MPSSRNRFDVLADAPSADANSSSKEQGPQVLFTGTEGTEDQTMQDAPQAVPRIDASTDEGSLKRKSEMLEKEERRKQKSRQGTLSTFVGEPIASVTSIQGLRKRKRSFDENEESSKRRGTGSLDLGQVVREPAMATAATMSDDKTVGPDAAMEFMSSASTPAVREAPALSPPSSFSSADIRNPRNPFLCVVQANDSSLIGTFAKNTPYYAFELKIDIGNPQNPTMIMGFLPFGDVGPQCGLTGWSLGEYIEHDWMVTDFKIHRVVDCPDNGNICRHDVLAACQTDRDRTRLICISLEAWPKIIGHFNGDDRWTNLNPVPKKLVSAVFTGRHPYHLRIWFRAPYDTEKFNKQCLSFFTRFFERRKAPLNDCFADSLEAQEAASSPSARCSMPFQPRMSLDDAFR